MNLRRLLYPLYEREIKRIAKQIIRQDRERFHKRESRLGLKCYIAGIMADNKGRIIDYHQAHETVESIVWGEES